MTVIGACVMGCLYGGVLFISLGLGMKLHWMNAFGNDPEPITISISIGMGVGCIFGSLAMTIWSIL